jgi:hypothetical protein
MAETPPDERTTTKQSGRDPLVCTKICNSPTASFSRLKFCALLITAMAILLLVTACRRAPQVGQSVSAGDQWHEFQGTWIASGNRQTIRLGADRRASIANLSGSLVLSGSSRPGLGFLADAVVLSDTTTGMVGRAVWTDDRGDQVYSELKGEGTATGSKISGTFVGGTGRYQGAVGSYDFVWRFVMDTEDGAVQGQSVGLNGRIRAGSPSGATDTGGSR